MSDVRLIGDRIRTLRELRHLTQGQLAYKAATTVTQISRLENDDRPGAQAVIVARVAEALNTTVDYLIGLTDDPRKPEDALDLDGLDAQMRHVVDQLVQRWLKIKDRDPEALKRLTNIALIQAEAFEAAVNASIKRERESSQVDSD